jgi:microcystin-dependent protein
MVKLIKKIVFSLFLTVMPFSASACGSTPYVGEICTFAFNFCPVGYAEANGQLLNIADFETLFNLIGTSYGGDGISTFAVPDSRGRIVVGKGQGSGLSNVTIGEQGGQENVTLGVLNLPQHTHIGRTSVISTLRGTTANGKSLNSQGNVLANQATANRYNTGNANVKLGASSIESTAMTSTSKTGNDMPFDNRQPFLGLTHCIALQGIYPTIN